jgi:hypothetical protein
MDKDRQMYQLHKKGYEDIAKAIQSMKMEAEIDIKVEVNGAVITDIKLEDEEEDS